MTLLVAKKVDMSNGTHIAFATDSLCLAGSTVTTVNKIKEHEGLVYSSCGCADWVHWMALFLRENSFNSDSVYDVSRFMLDYHKWIKNETGTYPSEDQQNAWLFVHDMKIFTVNKTFVEECDRHAAIGAGEQAAMALLNVGRGVYSVMEEVAKVNLYVQLPINMKIIAPEGLKIVSNSGTD